MINGADDHHVRETISIRATPVAVWAAIVDDDRRAGWWPHLELEARVGGRFQERWSDGSGRVITTVGRVVRVEPARLLETTWADEDWPANTIVEVRLSAAHAGYTDVTVTHTGWDRLPAGKRRASEHRDGWRLHLDALQAFVEERDSLH